jgi:hypothetical protein
VSELLSSAEVDFAFIRTELDVSTAGKLALGFEDARGLRLWIDGQAVAAGGRVEIDATRGVHQVLLRVELTQRKADVRVELLDVEGSGARARFVSGK